MMYFGFFQKFDKVFGIALFMQIQTRRSVTARFKEHNSHTTNNHIHFSSVAYHMKMKLNGGRRLYEHNLDVQNLKVLKVVTYQMKLDAYESILLYKNRKKKLMNNEQQIRILDQSNRGFFNHWKFFSSIYQVLIFGSEDECIAIEIYYRTIKIQ
jgi:hypothetical protein